MRFHVSIHATTITMDKRDAIHEEILSPGAPGDVELFRGSDTVLIPTPSADPKGETPAHAVEKD